MFPEKKNISISSYFS